MDTLLPIISQTLGAEAISCDAPATEKIGRSVGQATQGIFHITGQATTATGNRPWSAVVKILGLPENPNLEAQTHLTREWRVYRAGVFADLCGRVRAARCYAIEEHDGRQLVWLEDLSSAPQPPWQAEHFVSTAHHIGLFNAH